jgi:hypothetical protein
MFDGKLLAVKNGHYIGNRAPYGYRKIAYKENGRTCRTLEPHPEEAPAVKRIFEMYARGIGAPQICRVLDSEHIKPMDGDSWSPNSIREIMLNEHYLGKVRWNYRRNGKKVEDGEIVKYRALMEDYLLFEGRHPALVSQELWDAVQTIRGNLPKANHKNGGLKSPLARVLYCTCGKVMTYKQVKRKGEPIGFPRFFCSHYDCKTNGSARVHEVVDEVIQVLQAAIADFELQIDAGVDDSADIHRETVERLEKRLAELKELETKQWDEKIRGKIPDHVFDRLNGQTVAEIAEVSQALCETKDAAPVHVDLREKVATFYAALNALQNPDAPVEEQNKLVRACIERIEYSRPPLRKGKYKDNPPFKLEFTLRI